jgi:shikimate dehydrogenase
LALILVILKLDRDSTGGLGHPGAFDRIRKPHNAKKQRAIDTVIQSDPRHLRPLLGVVGYPVSHSRSPAMHNAAFDVCGLGWHYVKLPIQAGLFEPLVRALAGSGYVGANVTIPHKQRALHVSSNATAAACRIGAANTLTFYDGAIEADNTDALGILDALSVSVRGSEALVLGAGGSARAAVYALQLGGAAQVYVYNRTPERAAEVADALGCVNTASPRACDVLINATSVGLDSQTTVEGAVEALQLGSVSPPSVVVDLVYRTGPATPLSVWARRAGSTVVSGLEVLVRQGARSFERWTGLPAPLDTMREAALCDGCDG